MAQIECGRGHLYDPAVYPSCPYCGGQQITVASAGRTAPLRPSPLSATPAPAPIGGRPAAPVTAAQRTAPLSQPVPVTAAQRTAPLSQPVPVTAAQKTMPPRGYIMGGGPEQPPAPPAEDGRIRVADAGKTVGLMQSKMGFDPVVGWLACIEGPSRGKSYTIRGGINAIGRGDRMDIVITGDRKISSENHAKISYSDKNNRFNLIPGDGRNIIYLNDEEVFSAVPLSAYDLIDFGETKLLFIPLCSERFSWKDEEKA